LTEVTDLYEDFWLHLIEKRLDVLLTGKFSAALNSKGIVLFKGFYEDPVKISWEDVYNSFKDPFSPEEIELEVFRFQYGIPWLIRRQDDVTRTTG